MSKKKKKLIIMTVILLITVLLYIWGYALKVTSYSIKSDKIKSGLKIVFISDLHNCFFGGSDQSRLIEEIDSANPDIVIFGGDLVDMSGGTEHAETIMKYSAENYPSFYTPGNHEERRGDMRSFCKTAASLGVTVLDDNYAQLEVNEQPIRLYGVIDTFSADITLDDNDKNATGLDENYYNILLLHQPEQYSYYTESSSSFDLILSGHAHGGQWRIPVILEQGLYAPDQGLFPERTNGIFRQGNTTQIISKGLAKPLRMIFIPRIFNRPEFTIIEISD